ncbi:MAG: hypothetical protein ACKO7B_13380 [Flavobacteriales bacterium]
MKKPRRGFRNRYRSNMPWSEVLLKDLQSLFTDTISWLLNGCRLPVLVVYPDYPSKKTTIYKISRKLRFRITNKRIQRASHVMWFHDTTHATSEVLVQSFPNHSVINRRCTDISKKHVDRVHQAVFGYSTIIDPRSYSGNAVVKSDINALHDGEIVRCPVAVPNEKAVYQVLIHNETTSGEYLDYRVPIIQGTIPLVYSKYKRSEVRFTNDVHRSELHTPAEKFSEEELSLIASMASAMGCEFGEFDVLRDNASGRIYVIDVNKTPYGPPKGLPAADARKAINLLTDTFKKAFID